MYEFLFEIQEYLPMHATGSLSEYIEYVIESHRKSVDNDNLIGIYVTCHLLFMVCIYIKIWQIQKIYPDEINFVLHVQLGNNLVHDFYNLKKVGETKLCGLFYRLNMKKNDLNLYKNIISFRNQIAHVSGERIIDKNQLENKLYDYILFLEKLENYSKELTYNIYRKYYRVYKKFLDEGNIIDQTIEIEFVEPNMISIRDYYLLKDKFKNNYHKKIFEFISPN